MMAEQTGSLQPGERATRQSYKCFIVGLAALGVALLLGVGLELSGATPHGYGILVAVVAILAAIVGVSFWLVSVLAGLAVVRTNRRVLWWVLPEALVLIACALALLG